MSCIFCFISVYRCSTFNISPLSQIKIFSGDSGPNGTMNQYQTERRLTWCYAGITILLTLSVICIGIPFNHWRTTLDVCPGNYFENTNCGCIFFGVSTFQYFNGGHNSYCWYSIIAPIPVLVYALLMFLFHMYRVCISNVGQYEDEKTTAMEEMFVTLFLLFYDVVKDTRC